jgi:hypothetical protein
MVADLNPDLGTGFAMGASLAAVGSSVLFAGNDGVTGIELYEAMAPAARCS